MKRRIAREIEAFLFLIGIEWYNFWRPIRRWYRQIVYDLFYRSADERKRMDRYCDEFRRTRK